MLVTGPSVQASVIAGLDVLPSLEAEWTELFERTGLEPSVSCGWTRALTTDLRPDDRCYVVVLRRAGRLAAVIPLYGRTTRLFGQSHHILRPLPELKNTHSDVLVAEYSPELLTAFFGTLRSIDYRWDSVRISKLIEGHALTSALECAARRVGFDPKRQFRKAAYWLPLPGSYAEYLAARSSKFRNYARRAEKRLRASGALEVVEVTAPEAFVEGYDALLEVERASWKHGHGTAISAETRQTAFYRAWGREMAAEGRLHLQVLRLGGTPIAHNLGCIHRGVYYYLKTSYAAAYRPQSPATFLRLRLINDMIARGIRAIDFCGTPYEWEQQWTSEFRRHHVLSIYSDTWRGRLLARLDRWTHYSSSGDAVEHADPRQERPSD